MEHPALRIHQAEDDCYRRLIQSADKMTQCNQLIMRYQHFIRRIRYNRNYIAINPALAVIMLLALTAQGLCASVLPPLDHYQTNQFINQQQQQQQQQQQHGQVAQARMGGLEASDYVDEAGELEVLANQQQIPTAQLMSAAGHIVPENFFLPGGTIPALYSRYQHQQQQHASQQQAEQQQAASNVQSRHLSPLKYLRQADLMASASTSGASDQAAAENAQLIDFNSYNNLIAQPDGRGEPGSVPAPMDLAEFLNPGAAQSLYEHQQQLATEQQLQAELVAIQRQQQNLRQEQQQRTGQQSSVDSAALPSENSLSTLSANEVYAPAIGPAYQISGGGQNSQDSYAMSYGGSQQHQHQHQDKQERPYGLPTKSSDKEPSGMLKPLGNPKTISSPVIDFVTNQLPKTSNFEKLNDKLPSHQTPTIFSFSSSKDPMDKVKGVNQKKRNVMRQAEQLAKAMIKSVNDKFGTTIGDQTDIPFLLSSLGPLGIAQNILFDPSLLITLLNSAEKTYFADALPAPAKMAIRPVLNIFRVPNRKRDKANLLNIISYLASGGQTPSSPASNKNRQALGVEKQANKNSKSKE